MVEESDNMKKIIGLIIEETSIQFDKSALISLDARHHNLAILGGVVTKVVGLSFYKFGCNSIETDLSIRVLCLTLLMSLVDCRSKSKAKEKIGHIIDYLQAALLNSLEGKMGELLDVINSNSITGEEREQEINKIFEQLCKGIS